MDHVDFLHNFYRKAKAQGANFPNIKFSETNLSQTTRYRIATYLFNKEAVDAEDYALTRLLFQEELALRTYVSRHNAWQSYDVDLFYLSAYNLSQYRAIENLALFLAAKRIDFDAAIGFDQEFLLCFESDDVINYESEAGTDTSKDQVGWLKNYFTTVPAEEIDRNLNEWSKGKELYFSGFKFPISSDYVKRLLSLT